MYSFRALQALTGACPWHPLASLGTKERSFQNFRRVQQAHAERAKAQKEALRRRDAARDQAQAALQETGMLNDGFVLMPERNVAETMEVVETKNQEAKDDELDAVDAVESEVPEVTPVEGVQEVDEEPEDAVDETVEDVGPFEWTGFKDRCLGRLVAEHRYNFKKANGWKVNIIMILVND